MTECFSFIGGSKLTTGMSYACGNGFLPIMELLYTLEEVDPNLPDKDGNTPLIFAAQAGHGDVLNYLLQNFRRVRIDQCNHLGFTALMKAAIQGRTRCAKLLLFAGANPNRRDHGRGLCAEEWARFTGRHACAEAISKYVHSKKYFLKKTFILTREKWSSEPDILARSKCEKPKGNWISRHLSFKKKRGSRSGGFKSRDASPSRTGSLKETTRSSSSPMLYADPVTPPDTPHVARRPSCVDGVVPTSIIPRFKVTAEQSIHPPLLEENCPPKIAPPTILQTDFDEEKERKLQQAKVS